MINKKFTITFLFVFVFTSFCSFVIWQLFVLDKRLDTLDLNKKVEKSCAYEEIDLVLPVNSFLKRCANSSAHSYVRRLFVSQWVASNQADLVALAVYGQGATTYQELKKALLAGIEKEGETKSAAKFIKSALDIIDKDQNLVQHVDKSLVEGFDQSIHILKGQMMSLEQDSKEYKKLKTDYRKQLDLWIDKRHGKLLDEIIAHL